MKQLYIIMTVAAFACGCASAPRAESQTVQAPPSTSDLKGENCELQAPPKEINPEYIEWIDGAVFFMYPKTPPNNYTGCQTLWEVNSRGKSVIHFKQGKPVMAVVSLENKSPITCQINENEKPVLDNTQPCYIVHFMLNDYQKSARPFKYPIPPDRDPRR